MTATSVASLRGATPGQKTEFWLTPPTVNVGTGYWNSAWRGMNVPAAGAIPPVAPGAIPTKDTAGAIPFVNPLGAAVLYVVSLELTSLFDQNHTGFMVYDRLVHTSGIVSNITTPQTINSLSVPSGRDPNGLGAPVLAIECYTSAGTGTTSTATVSYTNQSGVSGRSATPMSTGGTAIAFDSAHIAANQMIFCDLQQGDTGVRSVESITFAGATSVAGNFGITLMRPIIVTDSSPLAVPVKRGWRTLGLPAVYNDSCLAIATMANLSAINHDLLGAVDLIQV